MIKEKSNFFGRKENTVGQNVMAAVEQCKQEVGIPSYYYDKMKAVLSEALTEYEYGIYCRGFGIDRERQKQCEIEEDLGIKKNSLSPMLHKSVKKLRKAPYIDRLRAITKTKAELIDTVAKLRAEGGSKELKATKHKLATAEQELTEIKGSNEKLTAENARLEYENGQLTRKLEEALQETQQAREKAAYWYDQCSVEKAKAKESNDALATFNKLINGSYKTVMMGLTTKVATISCSSLDELGLPDGVLGTLKRHGISNTVELMKMSRRSLTSMVGQNVTDRIDKCLRKVGLGLKAV